MKCRAKFSLAYRSGMFTLVVVSVRLLVVEGSPSWGHEVNRPDVPKIA